MMNSLDPRVTRLPSIGEPGNLPVKSPLDQLGTYEVFVQPKEGKPFQHEGAVHAPDLEMAFVLAKETFTRRFTCSSLCVAATADVAVSPLSEGNASVFELVRDSQGQQQAEPATFEIYFLLKRGKQMVHAGSVKAAGPAAAMLEAENKLNPGKLIFGVWAIPTSAFLFTAPEENDFWTTLPEKKFRDAADYKGGERLKNFVESGPSHQHGKS